MLLYLVTLCKYIYITFNHSLYMWKRYLRTALTRCADADYACWVLIDLQTNGIFKIVVYTGI